MARHPEGVGEHVFVSGATGSGKTYYSLWRAAQAALSGYAVLGWSYQHESWPGWTVADGASDWSTVDKAARRGALVAYWPPAGREESRRHMDAIVWRLVSRQDQSRPWLVLVDEADLIAPKGRLDGPVQYLATRGRKHNITLLAITQTPAQVDLVVPRNARQHVLFRCMYTGSYFAGHGMPGDRIQTGLAAAPPHSFYTWDGLHLAGPQVLRGGNIVQVPNSVT